VFCFVDRARRYTGRTRVIYTQRDGRSTAAKTNVRDDLCQTAGASSVWKPNPHRAPHAQRSLRRLCAHNRTRGTRPPLNDLRATVHGTNRPGRLTNAGNVVFFDSGTSCRCAQRALRSNTGAADGFVLFSFTSRETEIGNVSPGEGERARFTTGQASTCVTAQP